MDEKTPTAEYIDNFEKLLDKHSIVHKPNELERIVKNANMISKLDTPIILDQEEIKKYVYGRSKALSDLVKQYVIISLGVEFPEIDEKLFKLKRNLLLKTKGKENNIIEDYVIEDTKQEHVGKKNRHTDKSILLEAPLFVYTSLEKITEEIPLVEYKKRYSAGYYGHMKTKKVSITAKFPGNIDAEVKKIMRDILAEYHKIIQQIYTHPVLGEVLMQDSELKNKINNPELAIVWIPKAEYLNVTVSEHIEAPKDNDPALVLNVMDKKYLIKTWNIKEEEPFEKYLHMYTTGKN